MADNIETVDVDYIILALNKLSLDELRKVKLAINKMARDKYINNEINIKKAEWNKIYSLPNGSKLIFLHDSRPFKRGSIVIKDSSLGDGSIVIKKHPTSECKYTYLRPNMDIVPSRIPFGDANDIGLVMRIRNEKKNCLGKLFG